MAQAIELTIVPESDCALAAVHTHFAQRRLAGETEGEPDAEVAAQRQRVEVTNALEQAVARCEAGNFDAAQHLLRENAERLRSSPAKTPVSDALLGELNDAQQRMCSRQAFSSGGHAEVADAMQMYRMERCTNTCQSIKSSKRL